jgi:hypothetical protein
MASLNNDEGKGAPVKIRQDATAEVGKALRGLVTTAPTSLGPLAPPFRRTTSATAIAVRPERKKPRSRHGPGASSCLCSRTDERDATARFSPRLHTDFTLVGTKPTQAADKHHDKSMLRSIGWRSYCCHRHEPHVEPKANSRELIEVRQWW